jgi:hypothetical protein
MGNMSLEGRTVHEDVVEENQSAFTQNWLQSLIHNSKECVRGSCQAKSHYRKFVMSHASFEKPFGTPLLASTVSGDNRP